MQKDGLPKVLDCRQIDSTQNYTIGRLIPRTIKLQTDWLREFSDCKQIDSTQNYPAGRLTSNRIKLKGVWLTTVLYCRKPDRIRMHGVWLITVLNSRYWLQQHKNTDWLTHHRIILQYSTADKWTYRSIKKQSALYCKESDSPQNQITDGMTLQSPWLPTDWLNTLLDCRQIDSPQN